MSLNNGNNNNSFLNQIFYHAALNVNDIRKLSKKEVKQFVRISGDVENMDCILVDDMIDTGATVMTAIQVLNDNNARWVMVIDMVARIAFARDTFHGEQFGHKHSIIQQIN